LILVSTVASVDLLRPFPLSLEFGECLGERQNSIKQGKKSTTVSGDLSAVALQIRITFTYVSGQIVPIL
jgi:hypothetical protein